MVCFHIVLFTILSSETIDMTRPVSQNSRSIPDWPISVTIRRSLSAVCCYPPWPPTRYTCPHCSSALFRWFNLVNWLKKPNKITKCTVRGNEKLNTTNSNTIAYKNTAFPLFQKRYCLVCNATDIENECKCHVNNILT